MRSTIGNTADVGQTNPGIGLERRARTAVKGVVALVLFAILFAWIGGVTRLDLNAPLVYSSDALEMLAYFDQDYIHADINARLHAPFELQHDETWRYAYNALQHSNSNLIWAAYLLGGNAVKAMNFYYLATFLLAPGQCDWLTGQTIVMDGGNALATGGNFYELRAWSDADGLAARERIEAQNAKDRAAR